MTEYEMEKLCFSIVYTDDNTFLCKEYCSLNIVLSLKTIVLYLAQEKAFTHKIQENIYNYLTYVVSQRNENYEEKIKVVNEIKRIVNCQNCNEYEIFYRMQAINRSQCKEALSPSYDVSEDIELINNSISTDYFLLTTHNSDIVDDEEFVAASDAFSYIPIVYYYSLNTVLQEKPELLLDNKFYQRVKVVLDKIYQVNNYRAIKKTNKSIVRAIKKTNKTLVKKAR